MEKNKFKARFSLKISITGFCQPPSDNAFWNYFPRWYFNPKVAIESIQGILKNSLRSEIAKKEHQDVEEVEDGNEQDSQNDGGEVRS